MGSGKIYKSQYCISIRLLKVSPLFMFRVTDAYKNLDLVMAEEDAILYKSMRSFPGALQLLQVEVIRATI